MLQRERASNDIGSSSVSMAVVGIWVGTLTGIPCIVAVLGYGVFYAFVRTYIK